MTALAAALALLSLSVIAFQLVLMQILSISQWHHFAYMVISMAMLGFGAAGTTLTLFRAALERRYRWLFPLLSVATGIAMSAVVRLSGTAAGFDTYLLFFDRSQVINLAPMQ